jgi:hypothetical protein
LQAEQLGVNLTAAAAVVAQAVIAAQYQVSHQVVAVVLKPL